MDIRPILSTLRRHKTAAALIVLEVALTCAIVCNALFLVTQRVERISQTSGLAENELVFVRVSGIGKQTNGQARTQEDLSALRAVPGVTAAAKVNQLPFRPNSSNTSVSLKQEQERPTAFVTMYMFGEGGLSTLGLQLTAGRDFQPSEYSNVEDAQKNASTNTASSVIISRTLADRLYPGENALGKTFYMGSHCTWWVLSRHWPRPPITTTTPRCRWCCLCGPISPRGPYVLRTAPERREEVLKGAIAALERNDPNRLVREKLTYEAQRNDYFKNDRAMVGLLITVCISLLVVTALGIIGLASFWVQQRSKQIGIRRALGATRGQILRYFQTENFLLATLGIVLGMLAAYAINLALMNMYELPRMPLHYLPLGALLLWVLGQIAVFGPARRAAAVPPAVATRGA